MEGIKLEPSEDLAYCIGAIQTDGSLKTCLDKKVLAIRISFCVAENHCQW